MRKGRAKGTLSLSRALGDFDFKRNGSLPASKQMITAFPEVRAQRRSLEDPPPPPPPPPARRRRVQNDCLRPGGIRLNSLCSNQCAVNVSTYMARFDW